MDVGSYRPPAADAEADADAHDVSADCSDSVDRLCAATAAAACAGVVAAAGAGGGGASDGGGHVSAADDAPGLSPELGTRQKPLLEQLREQEAPPRQRQARDAPPPPKQSPLESAARYEAVAQDLRKILNVDSAFDVVPETRRLLAEMADQRQVTPHPHPTPMQMLARAPCCAHHTPC